MLHRRKSHGPLIAAVTFSAAITTGCGTTAKFVYPSNAQLLVQVYEQPKYEVSVAVLPFQEGRPDKNSMGGMFLAFIPLIPVGSVKYERPDAARMFNTIVEFQYNVPEDTAKAVVTSLQKSNLFRNVYFSYGGDAGNADYTINGIVKSTFYKGTIYTYGLSVYGGVLWFFGLPAGTSLNHLNFEMTMKRPNSQETLWSYAFDKEMTIVQGLYYRMGHDAKGYVTLMEEGMNRVVKDLSEKFPSLAGSP